MFYRLTDTSETETLVVLFSYTPEKFGRGINESDYCLLHKKCKCLVFVNTKFDFNNDFSGSEN